MENRFENTPPEEKQGRGAYATPPPGPGTQHNAAESAPQFLQHTTTPQLPQDLSLCERVREKLPYLLENDSVITPHMAKALYGHLSVCAGCSREFDESQRVVAFLDALPPVEMPVDFSGLIQRRIQMNDIPMNDAVRNEAIPSRTLRVAGVPLAAVGQQTTGTRTQQRTTQVTTTRQNTLHTQGLNTLQRLTLGSVCTAMMAFFVSTDWGRKMLGENVEVVRAWLSQVGEAFNRIPLVGHLFVLIFAALSEMGSLLGETYRTIGDMAVRGLAMDIALCLAAYYFLVARKQQRNQIRGV